jgi:DNA modification methylase
MDHLGQALDLFSIQDGSRITIQLKPYLQPFEELLALRELEGLCDPNKIEKTIDGYSVGDPKSLESLRLRLAYAQRIGVDRLDPTHQVLRELAQTSNPSEVTRLHSARRLRFGPHDLHEYRGKFFPQLVRSLINYAGLNPGSIVLDPMVGSGTTTTEAFALGMSGIGIDMNPLSALIAEVKSKLSAGLTKQELKAIKSFIESIPRKSSIKNYEDIWDQNTAEYLERWFAKSALCDVATMIRYIESDKNLLRRKLYLVALSGILRKISFQNEDDLRVRKVEKPYKANSAFKLFEERLESIYLQLERYSEVQKPSKLSSDEDIFVEIRQGDARISNEVFAEYASKVDCVITSPPYATALPYLDTDRLSLLALRLLEKDDLKGKESLMIGTREVSEKARQIWWDYYVENKKSLTREINTLINKVAAANHEEGIGFRRRNLPALLGKYFLDMERNFEAILRLLKPGSLAFYVVGSNSTSVNDEKLIIQTDVLLYKLAQKIGFEGVELIDMELLSSRDMFRENRGSSEKILVLRKPK